LALQRAARSLPESTQLILKRGKAVVRQDDWAASVKRLRMREQEGLNDIAQQNRALPGRKHVVIFALQLLPPWLEVEYSLAAALQLRGHVVGGILCDGLLPLCDMNLGPGERPPCGVCAGWQARHEDAFGFQFSRLTGFIAPGDRDVAERLVAGTPDHELPTLAVDGVSIGRLARRELQRYYRGFVFQPTADPAYRRWLVSAVLLVRLANRFLEREQPDIVVTANGRSLPSACRTTAPTRISSGGRASRKPPPRPRTVSR